MFSAISFGVFWRDAPSTSAIMRSTKVSPGFEVMRTTIRSESTRVPPVTAERSPPDSRTTGADSPVMADSSTEAMPWMMSPSPGIDSPADTTTMSPSRRSPDETSLDRGALGCGIRHLVVPRDEVRDRRRARLPQRVGLRLAAALGHRLREVREDHGEPEPDGDGPGERARHLGAARDLGSAEERLGDREHRGEHGADLDDEHDGVVPHLAWIELAEGAGQCLRRAAPGRSRPWGVSTASPSAAGCGRSSRKWWWTWISSALPPGDPA